MSVLWVMFSYFFHQTQGGGLTISALSGFDKPLKSWSFWDSMMTNLGDFETVTFSNCGISWDQPMIALHQTQKETWGSSTIKETAIKVRQMCKWSLVHLITYALSTTTKEGREDLIIRKVVQQPEALDWSLSVVQYPLSRNVNEQGADSLQLPELLLYL